MNIQEAFKCEDGTMFRLPETDGFEEEILELQKLGCTRTLIGENGEAVPLTQAYLNAEYIREN